MPEAVIVATARSPIGRAFKGSLVSCRADDLAATIVRALMEKVPEVDPAAVDDVIIGAANHAGEQSFNVARNIGLLAGLPDTVPGTASTASAPRRCSRSGSPSTPSRRGRATPSSPAASRACRARPARASSRRTPTRALRRARPDFVNHVYIAMGMTAENVAERCDVSREAMDEFAKLSQDRAVEAQKSGFFDREITPVALADGSLVARDDGPRPGTTLERLAELPPAFKPDGKVTAGNSCPLNDGAAAVLVMSDEQAAILGLRPLARIVASSVSGLAPEFMGLGPIEAVRKVLAATGMSIGDIDVVELNEAFAAQVLPVCQELRISIEDQLNPNGGAIALGHPFGMTGARIMTTLLNDLQTLDKSIGLETMCVGGGQGMAMIVERLA